MTELDHIVVAAHSLDQGVAYLRDLLGVDLPPGGKHPRMATHNHLLRLGPTVFLELIAIDPAAPPALRPRWFSLDEPALQAELATSPRLLTWVVRTGRIAELVLATSEPLGAIELLSRNDRRFLLTVPNDGRLVDGGLIPSAIHWAAEQHPAAHLPDLGYALERLDAAHPEPDTYRARLASLGAESLVHITAAPRGTPSRLTAQVRTPHGLRTVR